MPENQEDFLSIPFIRAELPFIRVALPCEECGKPGINLRYNLVGISGVLCQECLEAVIRQVNYALKATANEDSQVKE